MPLIFGNLSIKQTSGKNNIFFATVKKADARLTIIVLICLVKYVS